MNIPKTYSKSREDDIYNSWLEKGYFSAKIDKNKMPYTIMIPPPNITGQLHMGHALNNTIQDILIRFKRMQGYETLWMPGTDHAAIATEVRVIQELEKEGITKESLGREAFLERLWEWYEQYGGTIINQLKKLGASCDWERTRFTMDEGLSDAVLEVFVRLYGEGKIYRGERLINWCVKCQTSISDAEVEHDDKEGYLWHFKYPMDDGEFISFATTRPETMLGDTAVAVHPDDSRYASYIGKFVEVPMIGRKIPIIADSYVDPEYGTGVVKITPAHDPNDFEIGQRHNLPFINIMNDDGTINENGGSYAGLTRETARLEIIEDMKQRGLYVKSENLNHAVGEHDRCGTIIEPIMKLQWFVSMSELAKPALEAYTSGNLKFNRERFGKIYSHWLENIRDWCISRQLWWGHRIPAYYCAKGHVTVAKEMPTACTTCGAKDLTQDEDTLDTWFSSALWPFSTLGWPKKTMELEYFYPTNVLVTAPEIIFFWVVRMVFMGVKFMGEIPFNDVFVHGIVRASDGQKMSKSLNNGIDPLEIIDEYGADVLRLMLVSGNALDNDTRFFYERLDPARNFLNKLWNATRFILMNLENDDNIDTMPESITPKMEDNWIISRLNQLVREVTDKLDNHELGQAAQKIVDFIWDELCDWYVEMVKPRLYIEESKKLEATSSRKVAQNTLIKVLITSIKLLHPIAPFITEDLFLALQDKDDTVMFSSWPVFDVDLDNPSAEKNIEGIKEAIRAIRVVRAEKQVPPSKKIRVIIQPSDIATFDLYSHSCTYVGFLAGASSVEIKAVEKSDNISIDDAVSVIVLGATIYLPLDSLIDLEKEKMRLIKERNKLIEEISRIDTKLSNEGFVLKAPAILVSKEQEKRQNFANMLEKAEDELGRLGI